MKAKVIALKKLGEKEVKTTVNGKPVKVGDVVEVDENTFRNLAIKQILGPADKESEKVNLEEPSRLSKEQAEAQIESLVEAREARRLADEAAKEAARKKAA